MSTAYSILASQHHHTAGGRDHLPLLPTAFPVWTTLRLVVIMAFPIFFPRSLFCTELQRTHTEKNNMFTKPGLHQYDTALCSPSPLNRELAPPLAASVASRRSINSREVAKKKSGQQQR
ncbi:hypothetical protein INR49_012143 [Caranx melampygus]|nr:hypothetical protein INR49_012143 [Caranx melampygus]